MRHSVLDDAQRNKLTGAPPPGFDKSEPRIGASALADGMDSS